MKKENKNRQVRNSNALLFCKNYLNSYTLIKHGIECLEKRQPFDKMLLEHQERVESAYNRSGFNRTIKNNDEYCKKCLEILKLKLKMLDSSDLFDEYMNNLNEFYDEFINIPSEKRELILERVKQSLKWGFDL